MGVTMKVLLAYDGSLQAKNILQNMVQKDRESRNRLIVLHVFNSGLFVDYDAVPGAEELARRESSRYVADARKIIWDAGARIYARIVEKEGIPEEEVIGYLETEGVDMVLYPKRFKSIVRHVKTRPGKKAETAETAVPFRRPEGPRGIPVYRYP
jgi:uncharacterized DUF497 family protein